MDINVKEEFRATINRAMVNHSIADLYSSARKETMHDISQSNIGEWGRSRSLPTFGSVRRKIPRRPYVLRRPRMEHAANPAGVEAIPHRLLGESARDQRPLQALARVLAERLQVVA